MAHSFPDDWISAWLDGELSETESRQFEARMAEDPQLRDRVEAMRRLGEELRRLPSHHLPVSFASEIIDKINAQSATPAAASATRSSSKTDSTPETRSSHAQPPVAPTETHAPWKLTRKRLILVVGSMAAALLVGVSLVSRMSPLEILEVGMLTNESRETTMAPAVDSAPAAVAPTAGIAPRGEEWDTEFDVAEEKVESADLALSPSGPLVAPSLRGMEQAPAPAMDSETRHRQELINRFGSAGDRSRGGVEGPIDPTVPRFNSFAPDSANQPAAGPAASERPMSRSVAEDRNNDAPATQLGGGPGGPARGGSAGRDGLRTSSDPQIASASGGAPGAAPPGAGRNLSGGGGGPGGLPTPPGPELSEALPAAPEGVEADGNMNSLAQAAELMDPSEIGEPVQAAPGAEESYAFEGSEQLGLEGMGGGGLGGGGGFGGGFAPGLGGGLGYLAEDEVDEMSRKQAEFLGATWIVVLPENYLKEEAKEMAALLAEQATEPASPNSGIAPSSNPADPANSQVDQLEADHWNDDFRILALRSSSDLATEVQQPGQAGEPLAEAESVRLRELAEAEQIDVTNAEFWSRFEVIEVVDSPERIGELLTWVEQQPASDAYRVEVSRQLMDDKDAFGRGVEEAMESEELLAQDDSQSLVLGNEVEDTSETSDQEDAPMGDGEALSAASPESAASAEDGVAQQEPAPTVLATIDATTFMARRLSLEEARGIGLFITPEQSLDLLSRVDAPQESNEPAEVDNTETLGSGEALSDGALSDETLSDTVQESQATPEQWYLNGQSVPRFVLSDRLHALPALEEYLRRETQAVSPVDEAAGTSGDEDRAAGETGAATATEPEDSSSDPSDDKPESDGVIDRRWSRLLILVPRQPQ